jgi:hypothetical protein
MLNGFSRSVVRTSSDENGLVYPFAAVGIDYFGPLYVKLGPRTRSKNSTLAERFGCIFTCLRYRAVHHEDHLVLYIATMALTSKVLKQKLSKP